MGYVCEIKVEFGLDLRNHKNNFGLNEDVTSCVFFFIIITEFMKGVHAVGSSVAVGS